MLFRSDSIYASAMNWITPDELARIRTGLAASGFALWFSEYDLRDASGERAVFGGLRDFQEHLGGELTVTFPRGLGARHEVHEINLAKMDAAIKELQASERLA